MTIIANSRDTTIDASACDREPIHVLGHIQPCGFLIAVSMDWLIQHVSANIGDYLDCTAEDLPGEPLTSILSAQTIHSIRGRLQLLSTNEGTERLFGCDLMGNEQPFDVAVHLAGHSIIIEAEPSSIGKEVNPGALVKSMVARVQRTIGLEPLYRESVRQLRGITGFDRVMLYRFDEEGAGAVVAESVRGGLAPFIGLHYPASDIPVQARLLYMRNRTRGIWDVGGEPVPIVPSHNPYGEPLDLSLSVLRSVSPTHIQYLENMGVGASYSISIVISGRLWGLFALHHQVPRHLAMEVREATEIFGQMVSLIIEARHFQVSRAAEETARERHDRLLGKIVAATGSVEALADYSEELAEIIPCDGLTVWSAGKARSIGMVPADEDLPALSRFLNRAASSRIYATDRLSLVYPDADPFAGQAAGVLAIPISRSPRDYILFFRREVLETITWAGNPNAKVASETPDGLKLTPRHSFAAWQETVRGRSACWTPSEMKSAESLRTSILEVLLRFSEEADRERAISAQRQELLIAELNHRVRNILGLIRAVVSQSRPSAMTIDDFAKIISGRIQALARAHDQITSDSFSSTSLTEIIETEVRAFIGEKASRVHLSGPPILVDAKAFSTLALVFHELVTNSAKYGALVDRSGSITVEWRIEADGSCHILWKEAGGPPVQAPRRRGFGSTIIERSIPHDLFGTAALRYRLTGVEAEFTLPEGVFHSPATEPAGSAQASGSAPATTSSARSSLDGLTGLIVEDNMIIALDAEQLMLDKGFGTIFLASSVAEARRIILEQTIDIALLDVNLGTETSFVLAGDLNGRGVPYVFVTGYGERIELPAEAAGAVAIKKPFAADELIGAISNALARRAAAG